MYGNDGAVGADPVLVLDEPSALAVITFTKGGGQVTAGACLPVSLPGW